MIMTGNYLLNACEICCFSKFASMHNLPVIVGGCKFMGVVNLWILLICIIFMSQSKLTRCLSVHH